MAKTQAARPEGFDPGMGTTQKVLVAKQVGMRDTELRDRVGLD